MITNNTLICEGEFPKFIFFVSDIPHYIYYVFFPSIISIIILGFFIFYKNRGNIATKFFFTISLSMAAWMLSMLANWAQNNSGLAMFFDRLNILMGIIPALFIYLFFLNFYKKDLSILSLIFLFIPIIPVLLFLPTDYNVEKIELSWCESTSGYLYWYLVFVLILYIFIAFYLFMKKFKEGDKNIQKQITVLMIGFFIWTTLSAALGIIFPILGYQAMPVLANLRKFDIISI